MNSYFYRSWFVFLAIVIFGTHLRTSFPCRVFLGLAP